MTVYKYIYNIYIIQKLNIHDTEICVTDGLASLSFAGLARCETGPGNRKVCRGRCLFLGWMNFLGPETSLVSLKMQKDEVLCLKFGAKLVAAVSSWETILISTQQGFNVDGIPGC